MTGKDTNLISAVREARQVYSAIFRALVHEDSGLSPKDPAFAIQMDALSRQLELIDQLTQSLHQSADDPDPVADKMADCEPENRYKQIVENQTDLICLYQPDFTLTFVNSAYAALYHKRPEDLIGKNFFSLMAPEDRESSLGYISQISAATPVTSNEHRSLLPDGTVCWIQWTDQAFFDENQRITGYQGVGRDVTARRLAEEAEKEQRRYADALRESLIVLTSSLDVDRVIQHILEYATRVVPCDAVSITEYQNGIGRITHLLGYSPAAQTLLKEYRYPVQNSKHLQTILSGKTDLIPDTKVVKDWLALPGTEWIRSWIGVPIVIQGKVIGLLSVDSATPNRYSAVDVEHLEVFARYAALALKNAYEAAKLEGKVVEQTAELTYAKNQVEAILNNSMDGILLVYLHTGIHRTNATFDRLFGCQETDYLGEPLTALVTDEYKRNLLATLETVQFTQAGQTLEVQGLRMDGSSFDAELGIGYLGREEHNEAGFVCTVRDITGRRRAEEALNVKIESELEFQIYLKALHEITIKLTQIDQLEVFYRRVVEYGLEQLGFDRIALFLYEQENDEAVGTCGTSPEGFITDERGLRFVPGYDGAMRRAMNGAERFYCDYDVDLRQGIEAIGKGWNAAAMLWDGTRSVGWLVADNFIQKHPPSKALLDTLALYAMSVGTLLARKQTDAALRESESRYRLLAENITDIIVRLDPAVNFTYVSPSSFATLGYHPDELIDNSGLYYVNPDDNQTIRSLITHAKNGMLTLGAAPFRFRHKQGHWVWMEVTGQVIVAPETGEIVEFIASLRDITERKKAEEAIIQALTREKELGELKSRFVSMASHEFRTPLANIMATSDTLMTYRHKMTDEQVNQRFGNIRGQVDHLKDIIDDVLQVTRNDLQRVEYDPQPINLDALCQEIVSDFDIQSDALHYVVYTAQDIPPEMNMDRKLMRQLITNLLSNAIKYSPIEKSIKLSVNCIGSLCRITVIDEGIGIPEGDLKHLFEPFHRAVNVGTVSGTGLGLIIARKAAELHGGTIAIQSRVGEGTTVIVELPVDTGKEANRGEDLSN